MKKSFLFLSVYFVFGFCYAQNDLFFSHQALMPSYYNPATVGIDQNASVSFVYRNQWVGYVPTDPTQGGAPNTQLLNFSLPAVGLPIAGLGINVSSDRLGPVTNVQVQASTAIKFNLRYGSLQLGIMPGLYFKSIGSDLDFNDNKNEPLASVAGESQVKFSLGGGIYYQHANGSYLGLGVLNSLEPNFDFGVQSSNNLEQRTFVLHGGLQYNVGSSFSLMPNVNLRSNLSSLTADVGALLYYKSRLWSGLSYRLEEAATLYLGYALLQNKLKVGYAFDYIVQNRNAKSNTSHEIFIRYNLPEFVLGGRKTIKTPRFVF